MKKTLKKIIPFVIAVTFSLSLFGCGKNNSSNNTDSNTDIAQSSVEQILSKLTLEQKASQMVQGAVYAVSEDQMEKLGLGSVLSNFGSAPPDQAQWREKIMSLQAAAIKAPAKIPYIYGNDAVHGVNTCNGAVIFPHNIGIGAANDEDLTYKMALAVADEAKLTGMVWDFAPCLAVSADPRWGRTYESYSSDYRIVDKLGASFTKGLLDGGVVPCAKHFFADGDAKYGTGEGDRLIDRGDAQLTDTQIEELLSVYKHQVDAGVKSIMISHSSVNGVKMHENKKYITDVLKGEYGFKGVVISDWESIHNITGDNLKDQVITSINAGIDMLMEPTDYEDCARYIVEGVNEGKISKERVDDAVTRILTMKKDQGLLSDPGMKNQKTNKSEVGSDEYRDLARQLVEKSLVLVKNDGNVLPLKKGTKIYVCGPAADNSGVQCGGWTLSWEGAPVNGYIKNAKTILDGFKALEKEYGLTIITDKNKAKDADVTILCVAEKPYAEWTGDTEDLSITGSKAMPENTAAIAEAKALGKPTVACIVAGRNVIIDDYINDWDSVVMCYLPGSEADGISNVLLGKSQFSGKLAMPWYSSVNDIGTDKEKFKIGYGLNY